jgi:hypothetical protein
LACKELAANLYFTTSYFGAGISSRRAARKVTVEKLVASRGSSANTLVTSSARTVDIKLKQLLGETEVPAPLPAQEYYLP